MLHTFPSKENANFNFHRHNRHYNVPLVGCDVTPAAVSMDKYVMKAVLKDNDIPILDYYRIPKLFLRILHQIHLSLLTDTENPHALFQ